MNGFQIIMATNRIDVLDPALIRPGRIDRKIELPKPDEKTKLRIFQIHTSGMKIADEVKFEKIIAKERSLSGADCKVKYRLLFSLLFLLFTTTEMLLKGWPTLALKIKVRCSHLFCINDLEKKSMLFFYSRF